MFGSKSARIEALEGQVADLSGVVADYEQHSGYLEVARRIHEEHVELIGSMIGTTAIVGTDAYEMAVEVVRGQELTKAKDTAVKTIIAGKREDIVAKFVVDLMDDESVQADAAQVIDSADYQAKLADEARHHAVERIITLRKEAEADMYAELLKGHLENELERARKIASLNFEFSANGIVNFDNDFLKPILENGDMLELDIFRSGGINSKVRFKWIQTATKYGFLYHDWDGCTKDRIKYTMYTTDLSNEFWADKPLVQLGSAIGSASFDNVLVKEGSLSVRTENHQSQDPSKYGRLYIANADRYAATSAIRDGTTRIKIAGIKISQRRFAPDITDATT